MTERRLQGQIGLFIIFANVLVTLEVITFYFAGGIDFDEMTTSIALIAPMFSVYTTAIIKSIIANRRLITDRSARVSSQYILVSWLFPLLFTGWLTTLVALRAYNVGFETFEQFKWLLIASESIFGAYVGLLLGSMFQIDAAKMKPASARDTGSIHGSTEE